MRDACTQTERSDLQRIKKIQEQKRLAKIKEEQMRLRAEEAQKLQKSAPGNMLLQTDPRKNTHSQIGSRERTGAQSYIGERKTGQLFGSSGKMQMASDHKERRLHEMKVAGKF